MRNTHAINTKLKLPPKLLTQNSTKYTFEFSSAILSAPSNSLYYRGLSLFRLSLYCTSDISARIKGRYDRLEKIYADGGYRGKLIDIVRHTLNCEMEITLRTDKSTGFKPLTKRWIVERSFAWLDDFRRLAKDYERKVVYSENMVYLASVSLMLKWL